MSEPSCRKNDLSLLRTSLEEEGAKAEAEAIRVAETRATNFIF
jgi:hypothetical protein